MIISKPEISSGLTFQGTEIPWVAVFPVLFGVSVCPCKQARLHEGLHGTESNVLRGAGQLLLFLERWADPWDTRIRHGYVSGFPCGSTCFSVHTVLSQNMHRDLGRTVKELTEPFALVSSSMKQRAPLGLPFLICIEGPLLHLRGFP